MAEEIISAWATAIDLATELISTGRTRVIFLDAMEARAPGQSMLLRVEDATGNAVQFPLRLGSDTTFAAGGAGGERDEQ